MEWIQCGSIIIFSPVSVPTVKSMERQFKPKPNNQPERQKKKNKKNNKNIPHDSV